jgi:hypothetical protein
VRLGICAYCGQYTELTREHMMVAALRGDPAEHVRVFPPKLNHRHGGELVLEDVCAECNNVHLGKLDEFAVGWLSGLECQIQHEEAAARLLRWCAKHAYNGKRAWGAHKVDSRPVPVELPLWIIGKLPVNPGFRAMVTWIHPTHDASQSQSYGEITNDHTLDAALHLHQWLFILAWQHPGEFRSVDDRVPILVRHFPAQALREGESLNQRAVPRMRNPDWLLLGLTDESIWPDILEGARRKRSPGTRS